VCHDFGMGCNSPDAPWRPGSCAVLRLRYGEGVTESPQVLICRLPGSDPKRCDFDPVQHARGRRLQSMS
jgi:hypothetical protein